MNLKKLKRVTYSNDRSSSIDGFAYLIKRLPEVESKWKEETGLEHEVWVAMDWDCYRPMVISRNMYCNSKAEFSIEIECEEYLEGIPNFINDPGADDSFMNYVENEL